MMMEDIFWGMFALGIVIVFGLGILVMMAGCVITLRDMWRYWKTGKF